MAALTHEMASNVSASTLGRFKAFNASFRPLDELTYSLPLISALRLDPIYVARIPAAPFTVSTL
jgi:hypothetical protein